MGIDPSALVSLIDELERPGLAKCRPTPTIAALGRSRSLPRAATGWNGGRMAFQVEDAVLQGLTAAERRDLLRLLRRALDSAPPQPLWRAAEGD
jgi:hypothetical protein